MDISKKRLLSAMHLGGLTPKEVAIRTWAKIGEHEILTRAAAISFYAIAALVPFLALTITLTAWFLPWIGSNPSAEGSAASTALAPLHDLLPADAASLVDRELASLQQRQPTGIISFGLVALLWLSSSLFVAIMDAMNRIMGVQETRPFWKVRLTAMLLTVSQAAILIAVFATTLAWPQILKWLGLSQNQTAATLATLIHVAHGLRHDPLELLGGALLRPRRRPALGMDHARQPARHAGALVREPLFSRLCPELGQLQRHLRLARRDRGAHELALDLQHRAPDRGRAQQGD